MRAGVESALGSGVSATLCGDGAQALWLAGNVEPVLVILSATLPVVPAAEVASVLSQHGRCPATIAVGVAVGGADQAGPVLAAGAHSVVSRPYRAREFEPLLRSHRAEAERKREQAAVLTVGPLELDGPAFEARAAGRPLRLPLREFEILRLLMVHAGAVVSQEYLRQLIWGARGESVTSNTIAVHVRHLRRHLAGVCTIVNVRGVGYRLAVDPAGAGAPSALRRGSALGGIEAVS